MYNIISLEDPDICLVIFYPFREENREICKERIRELKDLGVTGVINYGPVSIGKFKVLGKGHAAIVSLAAHKSMGVVALKIRRSDSKRDSLENEAFILKILSETGYVPKLFLYSKNFIVREFIEGLLLKDFLEKYRDNHQMIRDLAENLVRSAWKIDSFNVDIEEISRPDKQIIIKNNDLLKIYYIDLESAKTNDHPANLNRIISFLISNKLMREALNIDENIVNILLSYLRDYRRGDHVIRERILIKIIETLFRKRHV